MTVLHEFTQKHDRYFILFIFIFFIYIMGGAGGGVTNRVLQNRQPKYRNNRPQVNS